MGRRALLALLGVSLLIACSAREGEGPEQASVLPKVVNLGPAGPEAGLATIALDEQGRILALIGREDGAEEAVLVRCLDRQCDEMSTATVPGNTGIVAFTSDGVPLLLLGDLLIRCLDLSCSSFTPGAIPDGLPLGMTVVPGGNPILAIADETEDRRLQFNLWLCQDSMCETREVAILEQGISGFDYPGQLELLPGGEPILFYRGNRGERALVCDDPQCTSVGEHDLKGTMEASGEPLDVALPVRSLVTAEPEVRLWLVGCTDKVCEELVRTEVGRVLGGLFRGDLADATAFVATGGVPVVVATGTIDDQFEAVLITCEDPICDVFDLTRLGSTSGLQVGAVSSPSGPLAITLNRSGGMWLILCDDPLACSDRR